MCEKFEQTLAYHCAPTLAGIKPASMVSLPAKDYGDPAALLAEYGALFSRRGICFEVLCQCPRRTLLLVYRPALLAATLRAPMARALLRRTGYPPFGALAEQLAFLRRRMEQEEFPHEIGLFLGYPPEDVAAFSVHHGENYKLCGHWKVYCDEESARRCFARYDRCRAALCRRLSHGCSLSEIFPVA